MKPNVAVFVIDALRVDRVGALGGKEITPNINALSADSFNFSNAFSTTNATDPAITSLQTGRYPLSHGIINHGRKVTNKEKTAIENISQLPGVLSTAGYRTGVFGRPLGRWHRNGFDVYPEGSDFSGFAGVKAHTRSALSNLHPVLSDFVAKSYRRTLGQLENQLRMRDNTRNIEDEVVGKFREFIKSNAKFYSFVHLMDTHTTYNANPNLVKTYLDRFDYDVSSYSTHMEVVPESFNQRVAEGEYPEIADKYYDDAGNPTTAVANAHYDATVTEADRRVGRMIEALQECDLLDETLVILLSDHGESLTEHGIYYDHHGLYDASVRIPLLIRPPTGGSGKTIDEFVQITDIAPTIASYTQVDGLDPDGRSLKPAMKDNQEIGREYILAEEAHTQRRRMIRSREEKLIYSLDGQTTCRYCDVEHAPVQELYYLIDDPGEQDNLFHRKQDHARELRKVAEKCAEKFKNRRIEGSADETIEYEDEEEIYDRLEALGYR